MVNTRPRTSSLWARFPALRSVALGVVASIIAACLVPLGWTASIADTDNPFANFYGTWGGSGSAIFSQGKRESLRCTAYYTGDKPTLKLAIRCASSSNKIELRANLTADGNRVTGQWEERSYNATGDGSGSLNGNDLKVTISGGVTGQLIVSTGDKDQLVSLKSSGTALDSVNLRLKRRSQR